jgi:hypothetical protein
MADKNKAHGLVLRKTTLRLLNIAELHMVGGAIIEPEEPICDDAKSSQTIWDGVSGVSAAYVTTKPRSYFCNGIIE